MRLHKILAAPARAQFGFKDGGITAHGYRLGTVLALAGATLLFTTASRGADYGLNGGTSGTPLDWNNSASWWQFSNAANQQVPGSADNAWVGAWWDTGGGAFFPQSTYTTLSSGALQVHDLNLAINNRDQNSQAQGTLNVTGASTSLGVLGSLNMNIWGNQNGNVSGTLNIDAATINVSNDSNIGTGGGLNSANVSISNGGQLNFANNLNVGTDRGVRGTNITLSETSQLNVLNSLNLNGTFNIGPSAQVNIGNDLNLRGGNWYDEGLGANSVAAYNLPLTSTPTAGMVSFGRSLTIANGYNQNVSLTVDSGATTASYSGGLYIASGDYANHGTLNLVGVAAANRTMNFAGDLQMSYGNARGDTTNGSFATLNLNNDGSNNFGAIVNIAGNLWAGYTNSNRDQQNSAAAINVSSKSQLNLTGGLFLNGSGSWNGASVNGSNWDPANYTLNLANTPTNGTVSFNGGLNLTTNDNYGNVSLTVGSGSATTINATQFNMAQSYSSQGTFTMGGNHVLHVSANDSYMATGGSDYGSGYSNNATLNLSNTAQLNFDGNLTMGMDRTSHVNQVNVNLANSSQLNIGNSLTFNGTFNIGPSAQVNIGNDLNLRGGNWYDEGLGANSVAAYNLALTSTPTAGMVSFGRSLTIANGYNQNVSLTVDSGATTASYAGGLYIASGDYANHGTLNLVGGAAANRTMNFAGDLQMSYGNARGDTTNGSFATLNLNNDGSNNFGAILNVAGNLLIGYSNNDQNQQNSAAEINISSQSQLNIGGSVYFRGSGAWNGSTFGTTSYNLGLAAAPTNGAMTFGGGLNIADTNFNKAAVTFTGTGTVSAHGDVNVATGYRTGGSLTLDGVSISSNGSGRFATAGDSGDPTNHPNTATVTLLNGASLSFNNQTQLGNGGSSSASITGNGTFDAGSNFYNSGRVVASGGTLNVNYGNLNTPSSGWNGNLQADGTQAGWYATDGGLLAMKNATVANGATKVIWGENASLSSLSTNSLVNSAQLTAAFSGSGGSAAINGVLIAPNLVTGLTNTIGVWDFRSMGGLSFTDGTLTFRYDDALAASLGAATNALEIFQFQAGNWTLISGASASGNLISTTANIVANFGSGSYFAIATAGGAGSVPSTTPYVGTRATTEIYATSANVDWTTDPGWYNRDRNTLVGAPQGRDNVHIGSGTGTTVALSDGQSYQAGNLYIGLSDDNNPASNYNWANGTLNISNGSTLNVVGNVQVASWSDNTTNGTLSLDGASTMNVGGALYLANNNNSTATLNLANGSILNVAGGAILGHGTKSVNIDATSQWNLTGGTLYLDNDRYTSDGANGSFKLPFASTPTGGKISVTAATSLAIRDQWGNDASLTLDGSANGITFNNLYLGTDVNTSNVATLNVAGATVTFNGNAELGSHYGENGGRWNNASATAVNVTSGGVLNIGGNVTAGGWSNNAQTSSTIAIAGDSQLNMTGTNMRLDLKAGNYSIAFANTPTNGKFSVSPTTNIWIANAEDNFTFQSTLTMAAGSNVQFNTLTMAWDNASQNSTANLNIGSASNVTFTGPAYMGGRSAWANQGQGVVNVSVADGSVLNFGNTMFMGGQSSLDLHDSGRVNVAGDVYLGGQGSATNITLGASSQINMTGAGRALALADGDYSGYVFTNTPTDGQFSVTQSTNLFVRPQAANATVAFGPGSNIQFNNLYLGTDVNTSNTATMNLSAATVTFSSNAELGSHYGDNGGRWNNAANTAINVANGSVLNFGGNVTAGGWSNNAQTTSTIAIESDSQINMTGNNMRLDLKAGNYSITR
ncbi:MAG: hypothetical protein K8T25_14180 [Planctomycetia bacterium]|nr:hypothetical protein [Planctomycetia bacterium]